MNFDVLVIGGGAAGLMAAITAAERGLKTAIVEKMSRPARKLMITGKGRCNLTNDTDVEGLISAVTKNGRFMYSAFSNFSASDTKKFFSDCGVPLKTERGNRVFPVSDKAVDIVDALVKRARSANVEIIQNTVKELVVDGDSVVGVINAEGSEYHARSVILATGGMSYPLTGSTGDGYKMAQAVGHTILEPRASLVPLVVREGWCSSLQGLALKNVSIKVTEHDKTKVVYEDFGELMMAHYGLSGPVALSASAHMSKIDKIHYDFYIDLKPALSEEKLDARILRDFEKYNQKNFDNSLQDLLPSRLISVVVKISKIPPETKVNQITRGQRLDLIKALKALKLEVIGFRPIEEAVVTSGGIKVSEIDPRSMESRIIRNLHFAGEVIDVDAYTGGFNLQIAFSTGRAAGKGVLEE